MPEFLDVEKEIEDRIVIGLRTIMSLDPTFTVYPDDIKKSEVLIAASKPRENTLGKPAVELDQVSYAIADSGLNNGYNNDIIDEEGDLAEERALRIDFSLVLIATSTSQSVSKNLANRIVDWMWIKGKDFFHKRLGTTITTMRKAPGNKFRPSENDEIFSNSVSIQGFMYIKVRIKDIELSGVLDKITIIQNNEISS